MGTLLDWQGWLNSWSKIRFAMELHDAATGQMNITVTVVVRMETGFIAEITRLIAFPLIGDVIKRRTVKMDQMKKIVTLKPI